MPWQRVGDTAMTHPKVMRAGRTAEERCTVFGFVVLCSTAAAAHLQDSFVSEAIAQQAGGASWEQLAKAAVRAGLFGKRQKDPDPEGWGYGWLVTRDETLLHQRTKAEVERERKHDALLRDLPIAIAVRLRDGDECRYCGKTVNFGDRKSARGGQLDHVDPDGDELVVACRECNRRKANRTPDEAGMTLLPVPTSVFFNPYTLKWLDKHNALPRDLRPGSQSDTAAGGDPAPSGITPQRDAEETSEQQPIRSGTGSGPDQVADLPPPGRDRVGSGPGLEGTGQVGSGTPAIAAPVSRSRKRGRRGTAA
jgi:hypothetical protein